MNAAGWIPEPNRYKRLSGSMLKWIAMITMVIDHMAASLLYRLMRGGFFEPASIAQWNRVYTYMRVIGRMAFPIFCFLLVEGFRHTHNVKRYAVRLGLFALISELPFDLAFYIPDPLTLDGLRQHCLEHQNVFFTLLIGLLTIWVMDTLAGQVRTLSEKRAWKANGTNLLVWLVLLLSVAAGGFAGYFCKVDYGWRGIVVIAVLYVFYQERGLASLAGYVVLFSKDANSLPGFLLMQLYNGERGSKMKYFFYLFYPVHLAILYVIGTLLLHMT